MAYYLINADGERDASFEHKMAFAGDNPQRDKIGRHSSLFQMLEVGDILFLYLSGEGYIGVGRVETAWDHKTHVGRERLRYQNPVTHEYRISVNWHKDWRGEPKRCTLAGLHVTPYYYQRINDAVYPIFKKWAR